MGLFAIGDIHGYTHSIVSLIDALNPSVDDVLVFLGDYVDKGPDVRGTLEFLVSMASQSDWVFLRGNHDQMFLNAVGNQSAYAMWECLAGSEPLLSYGQGTTSEVFRKVPDRHFDFLANRCVNFFETEDYIFVHAGIRSYIEPVDEEVDRLQWTSLCLAGGHLSGRTVVCGHSSQESGVIADLGHTICIDTGISKGNHITCLDLETFSFIQSDQNGSISKGCLANRNTS